MHSEKFRKAVREIFLWLENDYQCRFEFGVPENDYSVGGSNSFYTARYINHYAFLKVDLNTFQNIPKAFVGLGGAHAGVRNKYRNSYDLEYLASLDDSESCANGRSVTLMEALSNEEVSSLLRQYSTLLGEYGNSLFLGNLETFDVLHDAFVKEFHGRARHHP